MCFYRTNVMFLKDQKKCFFWSKITRIFVEDERFHSRKIILAFVLSTDTDTLISDIVKINF